MESKSKSETSPKLLVITVKILFVLVIFLTTIVYLLLVEAPKTETSLLKPSENVCETPECITLAHQMLNWGDKSVDPCDNFYQYACGKYSEHMESQSSSQWKSKTMKNSITEFLAKNASTTSTSKSKSKSETIMRELYWKCRDHSEKKEGNNEIYLDILETIQNIGDWPMLTDNWDDHFDPNRYLENMAQIGMMSFGLFAAAPMPGVHKILLTRDERFDHLKKDITVDIFQLIAFSGKTPIRSRIQKDLEDIKVFLRKLERLSRAPKNNNSSISSTIDIDRIIKAWMSTNRKSEWETIKKSIVLESLFQEEEKLDALIQSTPPRVVANLLIIRTIIYSFDLTSLPSSSKCGDFAISMLPRAATRIFVRNFFEKQNIGFMSDIVDGIKLEFLRMLNESTWLHPDTKKEAIRKMEKMRKIIGYPEELEADGALDRIFESSLNTHPSDSILTFMKKIFRFRSEQEMEFIVTRSLFVIHSDMFSPNAYYWYEQNIFILLAPMMDEPFFDASFPMYARLARIGSVIGHEIGHGFDLDSARYDADGQKRIWWKSDDLKEFQKRSQCLIDQYESYDDPSYGRNLNGTLTIDENAADLIGMTALWGYFKKMELEKERSIVGIHDYSFEKAYYHLIALNYCSSFETETLASRQTDDHGVSNFRVNGIFSNLKSFSDAFQCPLGSPMNPEEKCHFY